MALITLVIGASLKPERYSNMAIKKLRAFGHNVHAFGLRKGVVADVQIDHTPKPYPNIHTITLYMNASRQAPFYEYLTSLNPKRIIFNPGTENPELYKILDAQNIYYETACTLVLLSTGQYE